MERQSPDRLVEETSQPLTARKLGPMGKSLVETALAEDAITYQAGSPIVDEQVIRNNGAFYRVRSEAVDTSPALGYRVEFRVMDDTDRTKSSEQDSKPARLSSLPTVDRTALMTAFLNEVGKRIGPRTTGNGTVDGHATLRYGERARDRSTLVSDPQHRHIRYGTAQIKLTFKDRVDAEQTTFRLETEQVAASPTAYIEQVAARARTDALVLNGTDLSPQQREILNAAITGEYGHDQCLDKEEDVSQAYESLIMRLFNASQSDELRHLSTSRRYVVYNGTLYEATYAVSVP